MLKATVSGSFRRYMSAIYDAVEHLSELGVNVLSPSDPRVVDQIGEFVFVASDRVRSIKMVEDRHLECIAASDFLWLVAPEGYVGQSASMELGFAIAHNVPVLAEELPTDLTLRKYVRRVPSLADALQVAYGLQRPATRSNSFLIDPISAIDRAQNRLEDLRRSLARPVIRIRDVEGHEILEKRRGLADELAPPSVRKHKVAV